MKVLAICGSPRKGNTEFMLNKVLEGVGNVEKELILLRELRIEHCDGDSYCDKHKECKIKDDMCDIYKKIFDADILILGSPTYFNNVSGLMKDFIDRMNPYWQDKRLREKRAILISTGIATEKTALKTLEIFCEICKIPIIGKLAAKADDSGEVKNNITVINELKKLGKKLTNR